MSPTSITLGSLALLSLGINVWQWFVSRSFPLHHHPEAPVGAFPSLSLLKPLKGSDEHTEDCLRSWLGQTYPGRLQILFGVYDPEDPVVPLLERVLAEYSHLDAQLVFCRPLLGANAKVSTLVHLQGHSKGDIVVVSDADVLVEPRFLESVVEPFATHDIGLVNCFYRLGGAATPAMQWEAIAINSDFWSQVLQGCSLKPMDFALGAVMAVRRSALDGIGGFDALLNHLADDYQLGRHVAAQGLRIELSPRVVECRGPAMTWREVWNHQLRWARTIRVCQPIPWFFSILGNATLWPLLWALLAPGRAAAATLAACLCARMILAHDQQKRLTLSSSHVPWLWLVPIKDILHTALWALSFFGGRVHWRGQDYLVNSGGLLTPVSPPSTIP